MIAGAIGRAASVPMLVVSGTSTVAGLLRHALPVNEIRVVEAVTTPDALQIVRQLRPAVLLIAGRLPLQAAYDLVAAVRQEHPELRVLVVEPLPGAPEIAAALAPHVHEFIAADAADDAIVDRVRLAMQHHLYDLDRRDRLNELLLLEELGRLQLAGVAVDTALVAVSRQLMRLPGIDFAAMSWLDTELVIGESPTGGAYEAGEDQAGEDERRWSPGDVRTVLAAVPPPNAVGVADIDAGDLSPAARAAARRLGMRMLMRLPLGGADRPTGALLVGRRDAVAYTHRQVARLQHIARLISIMIERNVLLDDGRRQTERLNLLHEIIRDVLTATNAAAMLRMVAERAAAMFPAEAVRIWMKPGDTPGRPVVAAAVGAASRTLNGISERAGRTGLPVGANRRGKRSADLAHLAVPMKTGARVLGVIAVSAERPGDLRPDVQPLLAILAENVSAALELLRADVVDQEPPANGLSDAAVPLAMLPRGLLHDMVQPVTAALAMLEMLVTEESLTPVGQELADRMQRALSKVGLMTAADRNVVDMVPDASAGVRIERVVFEAIEMSQASFDSAGVTLRYDVAPDLPPVNGDAHDLGRVLMNLLVNAREAVADRTGEVHVTVEPGQDAGMERVAESVVVRVRDNGPGIPEELRTRVFQPNVTTKARRRRGLGLAICREIVDQHGGTIEVEPGEHGGACMRVTLPANRDALGRSR